MIFKPSTILDYFSHFFQLFYIMLEAQWLEHSDEKLHIVYDNESTLFECLKYNSFFYCSMKLVIHM